MNVKLWLIRDKIRGMGKISAVISVVQEELGVLPRAIASIKNLVDEIVIVDMTASGVKVSGAEVYKHKFSPWVEPVRNFGIAKAKGVWILILDPDEEIPDKLGRKLKNIVKKDKVDYVAIPRKNIIFGKWVKYSRWWPDYNIRFFKKGRVEWSEEIHAVPQTQGDGMDIPAKERVAILHHHYSSLSQYVERMNRYTTQHAKLKVSAGYDFKWHDLVRRPASEFLSRYFHGQAYKDGIHGLALSGLQAASELVLYLKIWEVEKFAEKNVNGKQVVKEMKKLRKDFNYWFADALLKNRGSLLNIIKRKFRLP